MIKEEQVRVEGRLVSLKDVDTAVPGLKELHSV